MSNLKNLECKQIEINKSFANSNETLPFTITDFWQWALSDLVENRNRGILAEFLVMKALGIEQDTRLEWEAFDLEKDGIKIEVKSAAYFQAWEQKKKSSISFNIAPTKSLLKDNSYSIETKRHADLYIFCLLHVEDESAQIDPMDVCQWTFYLVKSELLDYKFGKQKSISLSTVSALNIKKCSFHDLEKRFKNLTLVDGF